MSEIVMVKERPILFSGEMVRAILDGRKWQTRRVMKPQPVDEGNGWFNWGYKYGAPKASSPRTCQWHHPTWMREQHTAPLEDYCPYGEAGDRLWVRETFTIVPRTAYRLSEGVQQTLKPDCDHDAAIYKAGWVRSTHGWHWKPSIHMPRWASRILLEVTRVRVERVQDISEADAKAEGVQKNWIGNDCPPEYDNEYLDYRAASKGDYEGFPCYSARDSFVTLWDSINAKREDGAYSWEANPFVWVIDFKRITAAEIDPAASE